MNWMIDTSGKYSTVVNHKNGTTKITLIGYPNADDWMEVKRRALITIGKHPKTLPSSKWIEQMLCARHSPIRYAMYSFEFEDIPSNTSTHYARHVHAQPYISTLRPDRVADRPEYMDTLRDEFGEFLDSDHLPRMTPVGMILDANAEALMIMMNKRLCMTSAEVTRLIANGMAYLATTVTPQMDRLLVPMCVYCGSVCHEYDGGCGMYPHYLELRSDEK